MLSVQPPNLKPRGLQASVTVAAALPASAARRRAMSRGPSRRPSNHLPNVSRRSERRHRSAPTRRTTSSDAPSDPRRSLSLSVWENCRVWRRSRVRYFFWAKQTGFFQRSDMDEAREIATVKHGQWPAMTWIS